ncbi:MAG: cell envelope integrity protein CreD [Saccharospirillaceae bacterium]|nr:cell envelope integrity protein CreD [Pseudomonadales bacterium]NRB78973.1 cell envelope integrity protein CreD [Saccharospirillaceae bacterium]
MTIKPSASQQKLWIKILAILVLFLLLQLPMAFVKDSIKQRANSLADAKHNIEQSFSKSQSIVTPLFVVKYTTTTTSNVWDKNLKNYRSIKTTAQKTKLIAADQTHIQSDIQTFEKKIGIFSTPVFESNMTVKGTIPNNLIQLVEAQENFTKIQSIHLVTLINDLRGVTSIPQLKINKQNFLFEEGSIIDDSLTGLNVKLNLEVFKSENNKSIEFEFTLPFKGTNSLSIYPVGQNNEVNLSSNWPHPSFNGNFLPSKHNITDEGFEATWKLTSLSSNLSSLLSQCELGHCQKLINASLSVNLFEPVNHYTLSERAVKYANLFILLTFIAFFMFEIFKALSIHPLQYLMVGLSLSIFFLLLIALSEHFNFTTSYLISAFACISLISLYTSFILKSLQRALFISGTLSVIYFALFFILHSEDFAFLMGSILLFVLLTIVMLATRKLDWYNITSSITSNLSSNIQLNIKKEPTVAQSSGFNSSSDE